MQHNKHLDNVGNRREKLEIIKSGEIAIQKLRGVKLTELVESACF